MEDTELVFDYICKFYLKRTLKKNVDISLLGGDSGIILLQALLYRTTSNDAYKDAFEINLTLLLQHIQRSSSCPVSFCGGLAGFGWLCLYLAENELVDIESKTFYTEIDKILIDSQKQMLIENNWDALYGAIGLSLYFLKRGLYNHVENMIVYLKDTYHTYNKTDIVWLKSSTNDGSFDNYDLGLAHGNASLLYFLSKCYEKNILKSDCYSLIQGGVNFYFNNTQDQKNVQSFFPNSLKCNTYLDNIKPEYSRMAWCYGDLGILYTLYMVSRKLNLVERMQNFELMLEATTYRKSEADTSICDLGICHGSSGLSMIYKQLYLVTKNPLFNTTSEYWKDVTMSFVSGTKKIYDFEKKIYTKFQIEGFHVDILDGLSGLALLFVSEYIEVHQRHKKLGNWKEILLLA